MFPSLARCPTVTLTFTISWTTLRVVTTLTAGDATTRRCRDTDRSTTLLKHLLLFFQLRSSHEQCPSIIFIFDSPVLWIERGITACPGSGLDLTTRPTTSQLCILLIVSIARRLRVAPTRLFEPCFGTVGLGGVMFRPTGSPTGCPVCSTRSSSSPYSRFYVVKAAIAFASPLARRLVISGSSGDGGAGSSESRCGAEDNTSLRGCLAPTHIALTPGMRLFSTRVHKDQVSFAMYSSLVILNPQFVSLSLLGNWRVVPARIAHPSACVFAPSRLGPPYIVFRT